MKNIRFYTIADFVDVKIGMTFEEDIRYKGGKRKPPKISWQRLIRSGFKRFPRTESKGGQYVKLVGITALDQFFILEVSTKTPKRWYYRQKFPTASKATPKGAG